MLLVLLTITDAHCVAKKKEVLIMGCGIVNQCDSEFVLNYKNSMTTSVKPLLQAANQRRPSSCSWVLATSQVPPKSSEEPVGGQPPPP